MKPECDYRPSRRVSGGEESKRLGQTAREGIVCLQTKRAALKGGPIDHALRRTQKFSDKSLWIALHPAKYKACGRLKVRCWRAPMVSASAAI